LSILLVGERVQAAKVHRDLVTNSLLQVLESLHREARIVIDLKVARPRRELGFGCGVLLLDDLCSIFHTSLYGVHVSFG
jgi:hypothetical protein